MFRKYTALTASMMLAAALTPVFAEELAAIPTCGDDPAACRCITATCRHENATCWVCSTTSAPISGDSAASNAAALPLGNSAKLPGAAQSASTGHDYTTQSLSAQEQKMLNLLNSDRKNNGLAALAHDPELSRIARIKSADMRDRNYFAHESPTYGDVRTMLKTFGYQYQSASENIAHHANVDKAQAAFLSSPGHRANILGKGWTKVGVGIVYDKDGFIYATQIFAR